MAKFYPPHVRPDPVTDGHQVAHPLFIRLFFPFSAWPDWQAEGGIVLSTCLFVCPSVCSFVCYQTCERDILKTSEPSLMPVCTTVPRGKGVKRWTFGIRRSKTKFMRSRIRSQLENLDPRGGEWVFSIFVWFEACYSHCDSRVNLQFVRLFVCM